MGAADLQQPGAQLGVRGERLDRCFDEGALGGAVAYGQGGEFIVVCYPAETADDVAERRARDQL